MRRKGEGTHSLFIFFMWLSVFLRSYQAPFSVVVRLLFSSAGPFVCQEEAFNTQALGVNNRFDLRDKPECVLASESVCACVCVLLRLLFKLTGLCNKLFYR